MRVSLLVVEILFMYFVLLANVLSKIGMPLRLSWLHGSAIHMPKTVHFVDGKMAQWLRTLAFLLEDPSSFLSTHAKWLTTTSSSREPNTLF